MQNQTYTMRTIPAGRVGLVAGFGRAVGRIAQTGIGLLLTWQQRARERHMLAHVDEHVLRDLGLSRADVTQEADKPFWRA